MKKYEEQLMEALRIMVIETLNELGAESDGEGSSQSVKPVGQKKASGRKKGSGPVWTPSLNAKILRIYHKNGGGTEGINAVKEFGALDKRTSVVAFAQQLYRLLKAEEKQRKLKELLGEEDDETGEPGDEAAGTEDDE